MAIRESLDQLESYKNTGVLDVTALSMSGTTLTPGTAGVATASTMVVLDANKALDNVKTAKLSLGTSGSETDVTATAAELNVLHGVTAGTVSASKAVVVDASKVVDVLNISALFTSVAAKTAGTTQTQAGATAITSTVTVLTVGNGNDGVLLPAMTAGRVVIINNASATAGKVYANGTETLNGTAGNAGSTALTASKTMLVIGTGAGTSVSAAMM